MTDQGPPNEAKAVGAVAVATIAREIADQLNETHPPALWQLQRLIKTLGEAEARALLQDTLETEAKGGLMTRDGKRRRTPGGVYLFLARQRIKPADYRAVWPIQRKKKQPQGKPPRHRSNPTEPPFNWEERLEIVPEILPASGEATTVKITLIGRPGKIIEKGSVILTTMQSAKTPSLPKGLPKPPEKPTTYIVFIAQKQWRKVAETIKDPEDALIIEGFPAFDERLKAMAVFATNTTTKRLQQQKNEAKKAKASA